jgi:hypothetical protein
MGMVITTTFAAIVWLVFWAIGWKPIDAFLLAAVILIIGAAQRLVGPYLPGNNRAD